MAEQTIPTPHGGLSAYVARPTKPAPWPGVVVLHDAFGMTSALRQHADWLASAGYLAVAPRLFRYGGKLACIRQTMRDIAARSGPMFDDIDACRAWLVQQDGCNGRIGVIGYCLGGGFALLLAPGHGFSASSVNYGRLPRDAETFLDGACPIVASFGGKDRGLRGAAARLEKILTERHIAHDVKEYPDAGHSFADRHDPAELPFVVTLLQRATSAVFHAPSAADAEQRILAFFDRHLGAPQ